MSCGCGRSADQLERLVGWAASFGERTWAVEGAGGLGYLLAQQLVAAGERVVDVQPKLAARVRLLATGETNKNDPNDARSVAVAALRSTVPEVRVEDHAKVMKVWAKRHRDLVQSSHPAGLPAARRVVRADTGRVHRRDQRSSGHPSARRARARRGGGGGPPRRRRRAGRRPAPSSTTSCATPSERIAAAVKASKTTLTELFGVGPIIAATVIGDVGDVARFASRDAFAAYNGTAPIEVSSGARRKVFRLSRRGNRRLNHAIHMAAVTQIRYRHSPGRAYYDRKIAEGHTGKAAIRALKRRISDAIYTRLRDDATRAAGQTPTGPGGQPGNDSVACAAGSHPEHRLFGQATPEPDTTLRPTATTSRSPRAERPPRAPSEEPLDKQRGLVLVGAPIRFGHQIAWTFDHFR